ncbi:hypothetical protein SERLA73DRAFT_188677 [Serpula lacrymans var. lacrymans S7.3]|uniref:Uncharacterized protein n=2 Tax=Serpula lacrymans var. lacrymans TaxID=341189 RepID=F8QBX8_SERL3|nr:uncharacterized protein SERLADRAFT_479022 [Serpula lacrymans var. lacrymans S7.9]EGN94097.1 hypothetical protein SERLA73DRAFT_188677 [Serpula lacrymans var. lacrymans S7.3]EGO19508.1 hypothetical protein SERLADRAFT_479022 [Serpula lacrymans var. lacrymans S7.9]
MFLGRVSLKRWQSTSIIDPARTDTVEYGVVIICTISHRTTCFSRNSRRGAALLHCFSQRHAVAYCRRQRT